MTGIVSVPGSRQALRAEAKWGPGQVRRGLEQDQRKRCKPCTSKSLSPLAGRITSMFIEKLQGKRSHEISETVIHAGIGTYCTAALNRNI